MAKRIILPSGARSVCSAALVLLLSVRVGWGAEREKEGAEQGRRGDLPAEAAVGGLDPASRPEAGKAIRWLKVSIPNGSLEVAPGEGGRPSLEIYRLKDNQRMREGDAELGIAFEETPEGLAARVPGQGGQLIYRLRAPKEYALELATSNGHIEIDAYPGRVKAAASAGDIRVGQLGGEADLYSSGGSISVELAEGPLRAKSSGGDIKLGNLRKPAEVEASGGAIKIRQSDGALTAKASGGAVGIFGARGPVTAHASGGAVRVNFLKNPAGQNALRSEGAEVQAKLPRNSRLDLETKGDVTTGLEIEWQEGSGTDGFRKGRLGGGGEAQLQVQAARVVLEALRDGDKLVLWGEPWDERQAADARAREAMPEGVKRDGDQPREAREGDRPKEAARDGDRPRNGDRPREARRDGDRPKEAARDGGEREGGRPWHGELAKVEAAVKPAEPAAEKLTPSGVGLRDGTFVEAEILAMDGTNIRLRKAGGGEETLLTGQASFLILQPAPESRKAGLLQERRGVLLANGDFLEGEVTSLADQTILVSSPVFGQRQYKTAQTQAIVLRGAKSSPAPVPNALRGYAPMGLKLPTDDSTR